MTAALKLVPQAPAKEIVREPDRQGVVVGNARQIAGRKFIELGEKILSGEFDGASCEWRDGSWLGGEHETRSKICFVTLTPPTAHDDKGRVQLELFTIEEG